MQDKEIEKCMEAASHLEQKGLYNEAEEIYRTILLAEPRNLEVLLRLGVIKFCTGKEGDVLEICRQALAIKPDCFEAHNLWAMLLQPGDDYFVLLKKFHGWLQPENYVEIGVEIGQSLMLTDSSIPTVGIDPKLRLQFQPGKAAKTYEMTSDDFFDRYDLLQELGANRVHMAFIDGLHCFEQVLKDFINIERYSAPDTVVLLHDCLPLDKITSSRTRTTCFWSGDSWKSVLCLKEFRPDLVVFTIPSAPTGLGVVTGLNRGSTVLSDKYQEIVEKYMPLDFDYLGGRRGELLNLVANDWDVITRRLQLAGIKP